MQTIDCLYVFFTRDDAGHERILAPYVQGDTLPMVCPDPELLPTFMNLARKYVAATGEQLEVREFFFTQLIDIIGPGDVLAPRNGQG